MSDTSEIDLSNVPSWARSVLDRELQPQASQSALSYRENAAWPLLVEAAVVNTFLPKDLAPESVGAEDRSNAENVVLNFAQTSRTADGKLQWSLKDETRAEVIKATINTSSLKQAIDRTAKVFHDAGSEALRNCLSEKPVTESLDLNSLEATRIAVSSLSGVLPDIPRLSDFDINSLNRKIEFRRLLRVFERMIGRRRNADGSETIERFYGRDPEMEILRGYVGVIPADTFANRVRRGLKWLSRKIKGRPPLVIWGVGGVGKTTLVSKFMLEHAEAAVGQYPFAYLDFDRNTISARRPSGLLMEMCLQVGAQFDKLTEPMADLRSRIATLARTFESANEFESTSYLSSYTQEFRKLVDDFLHNEQTTFEWDRPFLLVFDTFEVVQYVADDIENLQDFVTSFSYPDRLWNRLRLIISGRKPIETFIEEVDSYELGALDEQGSMDMLMALAADAGKPVSEEEVQALVKAIAKATEEPTRGVQPLRLKLIGNLFQTESGDGSTIVKSLLDELSKPLQSGGLAASILIDGILVRRVLGHIRDPRVRALADPGLVVRRITPDVIKEVMTRGTADPSANEPADSDADPAVPWIVDDLEAQRIFEEFGKEGTLVEPDDSFSGEPDGEALRHRPDVRQQMLPLIRARRPNRFRLVHKLAFDYFSRELAAKKKENKNEMPSAAEAIYHGLWLNEPLETIDALWPKSPEFDPRIDAEEFEQRSPANIYLRAQAGEKLRINELSSLPPPIALNWLRHCSADLLEVRRVESAISAIRSIAGENYSAIGDDVGTAAVTCRLLYRAGRWDESYGLASRYLKGKKPYLQDLEVLSLVRTSLTIEAKSSLPELDRVGFAAHTTDPVSRIELCSYTILMSPETTRQELRERFKPMIEETAVSVSVPTWKIEQRILRLAVLTTQGSADLFRMWVTLRDRVPRELGAAHIIDMFARTLRDRPSYEAVIELGQKLRNGHGTAAWNELDAIWRNEKPTILAGLQSGELIYDCWRLLVHEHSDWVRPLGNGLTRWLRPKEGTMLLDELDRRGFWDRKSKAKQRRERDGIGIVQAAADEGRLLELAQLLATGIDRFRKGNSKDTVNQYPQDVFDLAVALLNWHALLAGYPPPQSPSFDDHH